MNDSKRPQESKLSKYANLATIIGLPLGVLTTVIAVLTYVGSGASNEPTQDHTIAQADNDEKEKDSSEDNSAIPSGDEQGKPTKPAKETDSRSNPNPSFVPPDPPLKKTIKPTPSVTSTDTPGSKLKKSHEAIVRGIAFAQKSEYRNAIKEFTEAIRLDPNSSEAFCKRATCYFNSADNDSAIPDFTKAINLDPENDAAWMGRALSYFRQNELPQGISDAKEAIRLAPSKRQDYGRDLAIGFLMLANEHGKTGKLFETIDDLTEAINYDPRNSNYYRQRAKAYRAINKKDLAAQDIKMAESLEK